MLILHLLLATCGLANGQVHNPRFATYKWDSLLLPAIGKPSAMLITDSLSLIETTSGLYTLIDDHVTPLLHPIHNDFIHATTIDKERLLVSTRNGGLAVTSDDGFTWTRLPVSNETKNVRALVARDSIIWALNTEGKLFRMSLRGMLVEIPHNVELPMSLTLIEDRLWVLGKRTVTEIDIASDTITTSLDLPAWTNKCVLFGQHLALLGKDSVGLLNVRRPETTHTRPSNNARLIAMNSVWLVTVSHNAVEFINPTTLKTELMYKLLNQLTKLHSLVVLDSLACLASATQSLSVDFIHPSKGLLSSTPFTQSQVSQGTVNLAVGPNSNDILVLPKESGLYLVRLFDPVPRNISSQLPNISRRSSVFLKEQYIIVSSLLGLCSFNYATKTWMRQMPVGSSGTPSMLSTNRNDTVVGLIDGRLQTYQPKRDTWSPLFSSDTTTLAVGIYSLDNSIAVIGDSTIDFILGNLQTIRTKTPSVYPVRWIAQVKESYVVGFYDGTYVWTWNSWTPLTEGLDSQTLVFSSAAATSNGIAMTGRDGLYLYDDTMKQRTVIAYPQLRQHDIIGVHGGRVFLTSTNSAIYSVNVN